MTGLSNHMRGVIMIICAACSFSVMNVFSRLAGDGVSAMQKTFLRNAVAILVILAILAREKKPIRIRKGCLPYHFLRSLFGTLGAIGNFYAVDHMILSDATVLVELSPIFIIIFSALILKEKATWRQWGIILLAFVGAALVIRPSGTGLVSIAALVALSVAVFAGVAYTMLRFLGLRGEDGSIIILFFSVFSCAACLPFVLMAYKPLTAAQFFFMLAASIFGCCGQLSVTAAYRYAPASEISVFNYSSVAFSALLGWAIFGQIADSLSYFGYCIMLAAVMLMFLVNRKKAREEAHARENIQV
ncbi:MAG: DMT family transporter [Clostridia bacterium]|nr:DMT family transporter [Clostridia bacterium]